MRIKLSLFLSAVVVFCAAALCMAACGPSEQVREPDTDIVIPGGREPDEAEAPTDEAETDDTFEADDTFEDDDPVTDDEPGSGETGESEVAHEHILSYIAAKSASCAQDGNMACWQCSTCGKYFLDGAATYEISANNIKITAEHSYERRTVLPNCTESGYTYYRCTVCGKERYEYTAALGHSYGEWYAISNDLCLSSGEQERSCIYCGATERRTVPAQGHNYREKYVEQATCTVGGYILYACTVCGEEEYEYTAALGHRYGEWNQTKAGTCVSVGEEARVCECCGDIELRTTTLGGHVYDKRVVDPTCEDEGFTLYRCKYCGDWYSADVTTKLTHDYEIYYVGDGFYYKCKHCGDIYM